jgi:hypothetical protein
MIIELLVATLLVAFGVGALAALIFARPIRRIMHRIIPEDISASWVRYLLFAVFVVGVGGGVNVRQLERYITPRSDGEVVALTGERWLLELYSTTIGALGAITWMLLVFFGFALVAYVFVRSAEFRRAEATGAVPGVPAGAA